MQVTVNQRAVECLYDKVEAGEYVTMSVFILSGPELKAMATIEGPVAPPHIDSGTQLLEATEHFRRGERFGEHTIAESVVDFEHLQASFESEEEEEEEDIPENEDATGRRDRIQRQREKARARRQREQQRQEATHQKIRSAGEPFQTTIQAKSAGWYRACVRGTWYQIVAEMEMRKSSDLGGMDKRTGHVYSYEDHGMKEHERLMQEDTASQEEGVDDKDFESTRSQLNRLRRLLNEIEKKQSQERHRLMVHKATNEHSHSRMVLSSLMETVMYMVITGFQVYTIRKWFSGAPVLGR